MCDAIFALWLRELDHDGESLKKLESFQDELVKGILKWPKHFSNTAATTVLDVPTMGSRVFERKLSFLQRVIGGTASGLSSLVKESFCDEISSLCVVKECRDLEEAMHTIFTEGILKGRLWGPERGRRRYRKIESLPGVRRSLLRLQKWQRVWGGPSFGMPALASEQHPLATGLQKLSRAMVHHGRGSRPCPLCDEDALLGY